VNDAEHDDRRKGLRIDINLHVIFDKPLVVVISREHHIASFGWTESKPREMQKEEKANA